VAYRMALDHPEVVAELAVLDIVPTGEIWRGADATFALGYWHWGFLAQAAPLPEQLMGGDPAGFWLAVERMGIKEGDDRYPPEVVAAYKAQLRDPGVVEAICEDYRAGATVDREHDEADRGRTAIACPARALWGGAGALPRFYDDPLELWRPYAPAITGRAIDGASHFLVEDAPGEVAADLTAFLGADD
jgi:haloacetate dehalogenase